MKNGLVRNAETPTDPVDALVVMERKGAGVDMGMKLSKEKVVLRQQSGKSRGVRVCEPG